MKVAETVLGRYVSDGHEALSPADREAAEEVFNLLLSEAQVQVRALLARSLNSCASLPREIACQMASDLDEVAVPILDCCQVLTDQDLLEIVRGTKGNEKLVAIAGRQAVNEAVSAALADVGGETVVETLVGNPGAALGEQTLETIAERHSHSTAVVTALFERGAVPGPVVEKLVGRISSEVRLALESKYGDRPEFTQLSHAIDRGLELANLTLGGLRFSDARLDYLLRHLTEHGQLCVFSSLCMADIELFEVSLSRRIRVPHATVRQLIRTPEGLRTIYGQADLPEPLYEAVELCVRSIQSLEAPDESSGQQFKSRPTPFQVAERMRQLAAGRAIEHLDYLYAMLNQQQLKHIRN